MTFNGIPVVTPEFVDKAHGDGYAVHPWTIDDEPTMKYLLETSASTGSCRRSRLRLEKAHVQHGRLAPAAARELTGQARTKKSSIACKCGRTRSTSARHDGGHQRRDDFDSRCAGTVALETKAGKRLARAGSTSAGASARRTRPSSDRDRFDAEAPEGDSGRQADPRGRPALRRVRDPDPLPGFLVLSQPAPRGRARRQRGAPRPRVGFRRRTGRRRPGSCAGGRRGRSSRCRCSRGGRPRSRAGRGSR